MVEVKEEEMEQNLAIRGRLEIHLKIAQLVTVVLQQMLKVGSFQISLLLAGCLVNVIPLPQQILEWVLLVFGFEVSPQAYDGTLLGEMIITDTATTKLVGNNKYITYKAAGVDGVDSRSWSFDWIAPDSTVSEVGFYGAFNSNPGHKGNDITSLSVLRVWRAGHKSNIHSNKVDSRLNVYPNPVNSNLTISFDQKIGSLSSVELYDLNGKLVKTLLSETFVPEGVFHSGFDISDISAGCYILSINNKVGRIYQSVIITGK